MQQNALLVYNTVNLDKHIQSCSHHHNKDREKVPAPLKFSYHSPWELVISTPITCTSPESHKNRAILSITLGI